MLKNLFISKVRIELLEQFLFNPAEEYHVRGLVRIIDEEINAIRRELLNLKAAGLLKVENKGNKVVYTLNPKCPVLPELRSMMYKDSEFGQNLYRIGTKIVNAELIILTHSYLNNKYESNIDVDVLFVGDIDIRKLTPEMKEIEKTLEKEIRYSVVTMKDFEFAKKKREPFLINILEKDKIVLLGSEKALAV
ncbi:MAG: Transcriptional regulator [candidate division WS6 bacterium GW2011_GWF2_39_15]|uniref:Transcriptional regulator n=1 Tax=candidate division WS6 bacterium GW2011_GWF2_39_15 TaxID=1619100 RepID=A0A0G0MNS9_9BACT|nr:MAG: Transcriptional regulator [candidate division WS6 bacterium GW2011_GWF2_39_15]